MDALALSSKFVPVFYKMTCDLQGMLSKLQSHDLLIAMLNIL